MEEELSKLTVVKLKERLVERGLDTKGVKAILIKRLVEAITSDEKAPEDEPVKDVPEEPAEAVELTKLEGNEGIEDKVEEIQKGDAALPKVEETEGKPENEVIAEVSAQDPIASGDEVSSQEGRGRRRKLSETTEPTIKKRLRSTSRGSSVERTKEPEEKAVVVEEPDLSMVQEETDDNAAACNEDDLLGDEPQAEDGAAVMSAAEIDGKSEELLRSSPETGAADAKDEPVQDAKKENTSAPGGAEAEEGKPATEAASGMEVDKVEVGDAPSQEKPSAVEPEALTEVSQGSQPASSDRSNGKDRKRERRSRFTDCEDSRDRVSERTAEACRDSEEDEYDGSVTLDPYTSDLNCTIERSTLIVTPHSEATFSMIPAGVKCTHGFVKGKLRFDLRVLEILQKEAKHSYVRIGVCELLEKQSANLGDDPRSWAVCSNGGKASSGDHESFIEIKSLTEDDVFTVLLNLDVEPAVLTFALNGKVEGAAFEISRSEPVEPEDETTETGGTEPVQAKADDVAQDESTVTAVLPEVEGDGTDTADPSEGGVEGTKPVDKDPRPSSSGALYPAALTKNVKIELNFGQKESTKIEKYEDYEYPQATPESWRVRTLTRPACRAESEVIMMVGLPSVGKTQWVQEYVKKNPSKHFNCLGTASILARISEKNSESTEKDLDLQKATSCLTKLIEVATSRRRNFILDQTNVYSSAQRSKLQKFEQFQRRVVVLVTDEDTLKKRHESRPKVELDFLPEKALLEMRASFELPSKSSSFDGDIEYPELPEDEAKKVVAAMNEEAARELGPGWSRRDRHPSSSGSSDQYRSRSNNRNDRSRNDSYHKGDNYRGRSAPRNDWPPPQGGFQRRWGNDNFGNRGPPRGGGGPSPYGFNQNQKDPRDRRDNDMGGFNRNRGRDDRGRDNRDRDYHDYNDSRDRYDNRDSRDYHYRNDRSGGRDYMNDRRSDVDRYGGASRNQDSRWNSNSQHSSPAMGQAASLSNFRNGSKTPQPWSSAAPAPSNQWSSTTMSSPHQQAAHQPKSGGQWQQYQWQQPAAQPQPWQQNKTPSNQGWRPSGHPTATQSPWSSSTPSTQLASATPVAPAASAIPQQQPWNPQWQAQWKMPSTTAPPSHGAAASYQTSYNSRATAPSGGAPQTPQYSAQQMAQWQQYAQYCQNQQFKSSQSAPPK